MGLTEEVLRAGQLRGQVGPVAAQMRAVSERMNQVIHLKPRPDLTGEQLEQLVKAQNDTLAGVIRQMRLYSSVCEGLLDQLESNVEGLCR